MRKLLILAGPTASGKSALALALGDIFAGTILNADAMQCYRDLRVLTARPSDADEARVAHRLYGVRDAADLVSAAWWRAAAEAQIVQTSGLALLCGGSFLYLRALLAGLTAIPDPGDAARSEARGLLASIGPEALHARLAQADPETAAGLRPSDRQRLARAYEVWLGTGRGLAAWHRAADPVDPPYDVLAILLEPERASLRAAISSRFSAMLAAGGVQEAAALLARDLPPDTPILRAHGVPELGGFLRGEWTLTEAARRATLAIGQYTKRQATWLRHQPLARPERTIRLPFRHEAGAALPEGLAATVAGWLARP